MTDALNKTTFNRWQAVKLFIGGLLCQYQRITVKSDKAITKGWIHCKTGKIYITSHKVF